jgi:uncharacterized protein
MMSEVFLDTAYAIALSSPNDLFHQRAILLAEQLETAGARLVTTCAVLLEIGNALSKQRYRPAALRLLDALETDPNVEIIPISKQLYDRAHQLYCERSDKEWGLTDCLSFVVMRERGLTEALTTDQHFLQAGFLALMREDLS